MDCKSVIRLKLLVFALFVSGLCAACGQAPSALEPRGAAAAEIGWLIWILIGLGTLIYVGVCAFILLAIWRRRGGEEARNRIGHVSQSHSKIVIWGGIVMPTVVLLGIAGLTLNSLISLAAIERADEITIEVTGHQWWWEVVYPEQGVVTANEIHVPVGQPVRLHLISEDVIHSFWVPQLHGKLDMIPGQTNSFTIEATTAGVYRGLCAEFCGIQHARMLFLIVAQPPAEFAAWLEAQQSPAAAPVDALAVQGQEIFLETPCAQCHAVAGTAAAGRLGPDLTHFASRREIGAGVLENTPENLTAWLVDPQQHKPGNLMPATVLPDRDIQALVTYLESLK